MDKGIDIEKIIDDRDTALRLTASLSGKLDILAKHICICGGRLAIKNGDLSPEESKKLSECLNVYA